MRATTMPTIIPGFPMEIVTPTAGVTRPYFMVVTMVVIMVLSGWVVIMVPLE